MDVQKVVGHLDSSGRLEHGLLERALRIDRCGLAPTSSGLDAETGRQSGDCYSSP
jgi:hypothetical protein